MASVYKTFTKSDIDNRNITELDSTSKQNIKNILDNFVTYFKAKHLS